MHYHHCAESVLLRVAVASGQHQGEGMEQIIPHTDKVLLAQHANGVAGGYDHPMDAVPVIVATQGLQEGERGGGNVVPFQEVQRELLNMMYGECMNDSCFLDCLTKAVFNRLKSMVTLFEHHDHAK